MDTSKSWPDEVEAAFTEWINRPKLLGDNPSDYVPFHKFVWLLVKHGIDPDLGELREEILHRLKDVYNEEWLEEHSHEVIVRIESLLWFASEHPDGPEAARRSFA